jgi:hypothetical protein
MFSFGDKVGCQGVLLWFLLHQLSLHFFVLEAICRVSGGDALTRLMALLKENTSKDVATQSVYEEK